MPTTRPAFLSATQQRGRTLVCLAGLAVQTVLWPLAAAAASPATLCERGLRQSPIDITLTQPQALPALQALYPSLDPHSPPRVVNDGHTVRVRFAPGSRLLIGREALTLQQFHFHTPGGDQIRGEAFPMAMHWLHKRASGQLVSLVVLFRLGADNAALAELLPQLPTPGEPERPLALGTAFDLTRLLPAHLAYYTYEGSLTASPCTEGVQWLMLKEPLSVSAAQLRRLHALFADNARPVQPLHGRVVRESR